MKSLDNALLWVVQRGCCVWYLPRTGSRAGVCSRSNEASSEVSTVPEGLSSPCEADRGEGPFLLLLSGLPPCCCCKGANSRAALIQALTSNSAAVNAGSTTGPELWMDAPECSRGRAEAGMASVWQRGGEKERGRGRKGRRKKGRANDDDQKDVDDADRTIRKKR